VKPNGLNWKVKGPILDLPIQRNGFDCGVFVCHYVEQLQKGGKMEFVHKDMEMKRSLIRQNLMKEKID
jgi:Ulp1 family protease